LVKEKLSDDAQVFAPKNGLSQGVARARQTVDTLPLKLYRRRQEGVFSPHWLPDTTRGTIEKMNPDIINLHWIGAGFTQIETLAKLNRPLVWSLHDMWAFTGGCHYSDGCDRYRQNCGACPQLQSDRPADLSRWIWQRKSSAWEKLDLTVVALSRWLGDCAKASSLFQNVRVEVIPNGIDPWQYRPMGKQLARQILGLPQDKRLILFGTLKATSDKRKGFHLLQAALQILRESEAGTDAELVIFGASEPENPPDFGLKSHYLGMFGDDVSLALIYSAADVFVLPSTQENLANTIMESLACGTPCVAFDIGGMPDLIDHLDSGYLAQPFDIQDLARGMAWVLAESERSGELAKNARRQVEQRFSQEQQARRYRALYEECVARSRAVLPLA
jgi:glycosyltransferase involved in cell wall biosynthesis